MFINPSDSHVLITGVVRNCGRSINKTISQIDHSTNIFKSKDWYIIESDSIDDTVNKLSTIRNAHSSFNFLTLGNLTEKHPQRTARIALCRNLYLDYISESIIKYDYILIFDLDGVNDALTSDALLSCWSRSDWDVCTANQTLYYDIWALRHEFLNPVDCWKQYNFLIKQLFLNEEFSLNFSVLSKMISIKPDCDWIEVDSAFGGLAIIKGDIATKARYVGLDEFNNEVCEHVIYNLNLKSQGAKIFINPKLINSHKTDHVKSKGFIAKIKRLVKSFFTF